MARKLKPTLMKNLWSEGTQTKLSTQNFNSYYKKAVDNMCLKADLCESVDDYVMTICDAMLELIEQGVPKKAIIENPVALSKILRLGEDMMEVTYKRSDLFYIGLFIDLRIAVNWFQKSFYKMIKMLVEQITHHAKDMPEKLKLKLRALVKKENYALYALYFLKSNAPPLKKVA